MGTVDKKSFANLSPLRLDFEIRMCTYRNYVHIFKDKKKVTTQQRKGERISIGEKCCSSKCRSLNVVYLFNIHLQLQAHVTGEN